MVQSRSGKWSEFQKKYNQRLKSINEPVIKLKHLVEKNKTVTLLYGAKDITHNEAVLLFQFLSS